MIDTDEKIVAFVDILGFSNLIKEYDKKQRREILTNLYDAVHTSVHVLQHSFPANINFSNQWDVKKYLDVKLFSDCLCISTPVQHETLDFYHHLRYFYMYLSTYQIVLMEKGYFVRGGITIGSYYSDANMIFSGGLVEAYELERDFAIYPRILVSAKLLLELHSFMTAENSISINRMFSTDKVDNRVFINPFNYLRVTSADADKEVEKLIERIGIPGIINTFEEVDLQETEKMIKKIERNINNEKIKNQDDIKILSKYLWLEDLIDYCRTGNKVKFKTLYNA